MRKKYSSPFISEFEVALEDILFDGSNDNDGDGSRFEGSDEEDGYNPGKSVDFEG